MPRAFRQTDISAVPRDQSAGEWQALRGELVALLDKVESHYSPETGDCGRESPALSGLSRRVRHLRDQMSNAEPAARRGETARTVTREVDRFVDHGAALLEAEEDELDAAIKEIRAGQPVLPFPDRRLGLRRQSDRNAARPDFQQFGTLIEGMSRRLGQLEEELRTQRSNAGSVREVAAQVEQLTQVMELMAGAVGETGQVKRLESQIAALGSIIENKPRLNLDALNARLDDMSATVSRLAEFQAQQMEREVAREKHRASTPRPEQLAKLAPAMKSIEESVRNVYDRIDAIERSVALSSSDFERLTTEMAAFTKAMQDNAAAPEVLVSRIEGLAQRLENVDSADGEVVGLRSDLASLRDVMLQGIEPRFSRLEDQIEALNDRIAPVDTSAVESQLKALMARMDDAGNQLDGLTRLYSSGGDSKPGLDALEERVGALLSSASQDTAERLARLEAILAGKLASNEVRRPEPARPAAETPQPLEAEAPPESIDMLLAGIKSHQDDAMPANPGEDAPLIDRGFPDSTPTRSPRAPVAAAAAKVQRAAPAAQSEPPHFDPNQVQRPPRPRSSFAPEGSDPFAEARSAAAAPGAPTPEVPASSTSTFVAAARRAQRARQEQKEAVEDNGSLIGRALARVRPQKEAVAEAPVAEQAERPAKRSKHDEQKSRKSGAKGNGGNDGVQAGFLARNRRPLLLAATLVAVSLLALNLVLQRAGSSARQAAVDETVQVETLPEEPTPVTEQVGAVTPRVIDMIDPTATGSINPGSPMSFSRAADLGIPPAELRVPAAVAQTAAVVAPEAFELPAEAVGPLALREAAARGNPQAQFEVAAVYGEGRLVQKNEAEAARWYERAAAQGFAPAQYRLGNLYEMGTGVEKDLDQAKLWYQRAAEAGNRMAMHNLAALFAGGQLGDQQFELAAQWFTEAAARGMTDSQFNLGMLYARGLGVEQDFAQSYKWFALAAQQGDKDASQARDDIGKSLSAEALARVNEELRAFRRQPIDLDANFASIGTWSPSFDPGEAITTKDVIARVQQALGKLGFDVGSPDGVAGPKTAEAIRAFERATGMSESGRVNPRLLAVLGSQPV